MKALKEKFERVQTLVNRIDSLPDNDQVFVLGWLVVWLVGRCQRTSSVTLLLCAALKRMNERSAIEKLNSIESYALHLGFDEGIERLNPKPSTLSPACSQRMRCRDFDC